MRSEILFNTDWLFIPEQVNDDIADDQFERVTLPHSNKILPYHNFDDAEYQFISTYRKRFTLPEALNGRRLYLDFKGAMLAATVTINGHTFEEHRGGYTPFSFDITEYINQEGENLLTVHLDSTERHDIPPFGGRVDYLTFGGIYRDVKLRYVYPVHIENVRVRTLDVLTDNPRVEVDVWMQNDTDKEQSVLVQVVVGPRKFSSALAHTELLEISTNPKSVIKYSTEYRLDKKDITLWQLDEPFIDSVFVTLYENTEAKEAIDSNSWEFGFRETEFREDGFYLNGEKVFLRGLNRHQTYPYVGAAVSDRLQAYDADILKYELGCNIVRTSHYPQSTAFLDRCDEIGLLVFEEIPGWQWIGDDDWKQISLRDVRAMIERDWNHPSIIIWGVRINESWDDNEFYAQTNTLARELDSTRPTTGVRFWQDSNFLEDVFGFNDFSNGVEEPKQTPHMITEFNGHMFPTKTFDGEERRVEHAVRHAKIQSQAVSMGGVSAAIGWCAFDYNTHKDFGSGDRICYHGVMDMFRQPKYAGYFYASQIDPSEKIVLHAATGWTMGDRSVGGNEPLIVFSNCEEIDIYIGEDHFGTFQPDAEAYPNLPHSPFTVTGMTGEMLWGGEWHDLRVVGKINGEQVAEQIIEADGLPEKLILEAAHDSLKADGADMTWLFFRVVDAHDNVLPYSLTVVNFEIVSGTVELIGENPFALVGGQAALLVKATHEPSTVVIRASAPRLPDAEVTIEIK